MTEPNLPPPAPPAPPAPTEPPTGEQKRVTRFGRAIGEPQEAVFHFKGALLTVAGGVVTAAVALLGISASRTAPLPHTEYLVASLILGCASMALVLLSMAGLNLGTALLENFRRLSLTTCIFALLPMLVFSWLNFAPQHRTDAATASLFGLALSPQEVRSLGRAVAPDPALIALFTPPRNPLAPDPASGLPNLGEPVPHLGGLSFRLGQRLFDEAGALPPTAELEAAIRRMLVPELTAVMPQLTDLHQRAKYNEVSITAWALPELADFYQWIFYDSPDPELWLKDDPEVYLPLYHEWLAQFLTRFFLATPHEPWGADLATADESAWQDIYATWLYSHWLPPPTTLGDHGNLTIDFQQALLDPSVGPDPGLADLLVPPTTANSYFFPSDGDPQSHLGAMSERLGRPVLANIDGTTGVGRIERQLAAGVLTEVARARRAVRTFHQADRQTLTPPDALNAARGDLQQWLRANDTRHQTWDNAKPTQAEPLVFAWLLQLNTRFLLYITDDPGHQEALLSGDQAQWIAEFDDWFFRVYLPPPPPTTPASPYSNWDLQTFSDPNPIFEPSVP